VLFSKLVKAIKDSPLFYPIRSFLDSRMRRNLRKGSVLVNPFSPFILSDFYLSNEVHKLGLGFLNPKSKPIDSSTVYFRHATVFCQVDQLEEFAEIVLKNLNVPITLITGKWELPALEDTTCVRQILNHPMIYRWYSQNQVFAHLDIEPFPYGVNLFTSHKVLKIMKKRRNPRKPVGLLVPFATIHPHLSKDVAKIRKSLLELMEPPMPIDRYLRSISRAEYVISPPGDRPDTYRHWECVALSSIPICLETTNFDRIFGNTLVSVKSLSQFSVRDKSVTNATPNEELAYASFWGTKVRAEETR
jgi:hypothetical protein